MPKLPRDSSASNANNVEESPLELVLAPKRSDTWWRIAYIGTSIVAALLIGYLSGSRTGLERTLGSRIDPDQAELLRSPPPKIKVTTDARDKQEIARLANEIDSLRTQIEQVRHSADNLHAQERLRMPEVAPEQSSEAGQTSSSVVARLDKLETRLAQVERGMLDRMPSAVSGPEPSSITKPSDNPELNARAPDQKGVGAPKAIVDYGLHHVERGHAFVKRPDGFLEEVVRGDELPGAGRVTAIERRNDGWIVMTTQGIIIRRP